jgi:hypothetical protein
MKINTIESGCTFGCKSKIELKVFSAHTKISISKECLSSLMALFVSYKPHDENIKAIPFGGLAFTV